MENEHEELKSSAPSILRDRPIYFFATVLFRPTYDLPRISTCPLLPFLAADAWIHSVGWRPSRPSVPLTIFRGRFQALLPPPVRASRRLTSNCNLIEFFRFPPVQVLPLRRFTGCAYERSIAAAVYFDNKFSVLARVNSVLDTGRRLDSKITGARVENKVVTPLLHIYMGVDDRLLGGRLQSALWAMKSDLEDARGEKIEFDAGSGAERIIFDGREDVVPPPAQGPRVVVQGRIVEQGEQEVGSRVSTSAGRIVEQGEQAVGSSVGSWADSGAG